MLGTQNQQKALNSFVTDFRNALEGQDGLPRRLQDLGLQERAEGARRRPTPPPRPRRRSRPRRWRPAERLSGPDGVAAAVARLDALTRRLRRECPWDREQDERSIVPHTVEEAYELAAAAHGDDDAKLLDELGDVLFQVHFLALLLEERGAGSLAEVAEHVRQKLIRRHPHIFGGRCEVERARPRCCATGTPSRRRRPGREPGIFGEVPENLPGPLYARKVQRRAASSGFDFDHVPYEAVARRARGAGGGRRPRGGLPRGRRRAVRGGQRRAQAEGGSGARAARLGRALPRARAGGRRPGRIRRRGLGTISPADAQLAYYARARLNEEPDP